MHPYIAYGLIAALVVAAIAVVMRFINDAAKLKEPSFRHTFDASEHVEISKKAESTDRQ